MAEKPKHPASSRIIVVDKDNDIRTMMEMILCDHFQVDTSESAEAGLGLLESKGPFDIAIASFTLPGMNGVEFLRRVGEKYPETVRILLSGGLADMSDLSLAVSKGHISRIILKPFLMDTLLEQLNSDLSVKNNISGITPVPIPALL
jgi:two-component system, NtrC family, sensor kinase